MMCALSAGVGMVIVQGSSWCNGDERCSGMLMFVINGGGVEQSESELVVS